MAGLVLQTASSQYEELILLLKHGLPSPNRKLWYTATDLHELLVHGGISSLPLNIVTKALNSNRDNKYGIAVNDFQKKRWCCFDHDASDMSSFDTPRLQLKVLKAATDDEKKALMPDIPRNHFRTFQLKYLRGYAPAASPTPAATASHATSETLSESTQPMRPGAESPTQQASSPVASETSSPGTDSASSSAASETERTQLVRPRANASTSSATSASSSPAATSETPRESTQSARPRADSTFPATESARSSVASETESTQPARPRADASTSPASATSETTSESAQPAPPRPDASARRAAPNPALQGTAPVAVPLCQPVAPTTVTPQKKKGGNQADLPCELPDGERVGFAFTAIGKFSEVIKIAEEHARQCSGNCGLHLKRRYKSDFQLVEIHGCNFCNKEYTIKSGHADPDAKKKRGGQISDLTKVIGHAAHGAALTPTMLGEFLDQMGCIRSGNKGVKQMYSRRKAVLILVAKEQLRKNRIDHNAAVRAKHGTKRDVIFTDSDGVVHSICSSAIASDGGGETRAYNHRITGNQHCTILFSCVTGKPLAIKHDQISCVHCTRALTKAIASGKRASEITEDDLKHDGKECYRNTKHGPAVAEEYALEYLAEYLLVDPDTGKLRPDDEAILALHIIADGDTKGPKRFIAKQAEIVTSFVGKAEHIPDIGHFIKCISGGLFNLAKEHSHLRGVHLLEAARIKTICADVSRIVREYGVELRELNQGENPDVAKINKARDVALKRLECIIPHHCGDHSNCFAGECTYKKLERNFVAKYKTMPENSQCTKSSADILKENKAQILKDYAKVARFNGKVMSMGKEGQAVVYKEISKRLDAKNIDRVAMAMSSNDCEGFYGMLTKYSHGKRIYLGQADSWEAYQYLVAGKKSDDRFEDLVQARDGVVSSYVRDLGTGRALKEKQINRKRQKGSIYMQRRKVRQFAKLKDVDKNKTASARHKPNKLSPKDACKSLPPKKTTKRKRNGTRCKNCNLWHEGQCIEPTYEAPKKKRKTKNGNNDEAKLEDMYQCLYGN